MTTNTTTKQGPIEEFSSATIRGSIWENEVLHEGQKIIVHNVKVTRSYRDKDGNWQDTNSYRPQDLAHLRLVAEAAQNFLYLRQRSQTPNKAAAGSTDEEIAS